MLRILLIIGSILSANLTLATNDTLTNSPSKAALNIFEKTLSSIQKFKQKNQTNAENIKNLIEENLLPNIAIEVATQLTLKKHWSSLSKRQKQIFQDYIVESLIKDYAGVFTHYDKFDSVKISADPNVKRRGNKAIVKLSISLGGDSKPINTSIKMIYESKWRIYDVVFSGVSLVKTYSAQFNSHIKRKGVESLVNTLLEKLAKL